MVKSAIGSIQFGIPPETLKDSMKVGLPVPEYYIIPDKTFDWNDGTSVMEFEFPVYYNFFMRKQNRTKLICDYQTAQNIKVIFQETLYFRRKHTRAKLLLPTYIFKIQKKK